MRITSGPAMAAAVALSCFAAAAPSAAQTGPAETGRAALQAAGPLYTYGPPYRYAPYDQPRPWWGWGAYDTRNRDFSYRPWGPSWGAYRQSPPYRRYDSWWMPRWRDNWPGYGPRPWDWRPPY
jgi:hypothetical protein